MLTRLTDFVEHGVIDNRRRDLVLVQLYLYGQSDPLEFRLEGNCRKDLAGSRAVFKVKDDLLGRLSSNGPFNPGSYHGLAGDITASRRVKSRGGDRPLSNVLYAELFSRELGLLVLEGDRYEIRVSPFEWVMDDGDEQAQIMCSQQILRDYVRDWIDRFSRTHEENSPLPDHRWDIRLREAEGVAIAFQEVHYKYRHLACGDTCEAFVMGWDDMLGELADSDENGTSFCCRISGSLSLFDILDDEEAIDAQLSMSHPVFQEVIHLTETAQKLFAKEINDLQISRKTPSEELGIVFHSIRYITPNILSCLLQINEGGAKYDILAERMNRCASCLAKALNALSGIKVKGINAFHDQLAVLHQDVVELRKDFLKQSKL